MSYRILMLGLSLFLLIGCGHNPPRKAEKRFVKDEECQYQQAYREWGFVNRKELLTGKGWDNCVGYSFDKLTDYNLAYEGWFRHYISLGELERKWKGKPMPEGMLAFLENCRIRCNQNTFTIRGGEERK